jgi:flavorubredoxin
MSTTIHEIAPQVFRVSTPVPPEVIPGGFSFNQYLVVDDAPLLFHTGPRRMFPLVREAVARVLGDVSRLRYLAFSHVEADECGSLPAWLDAAPAAVPVCSTVAAMVSVSDLVDRAPRPLADGETLDLGAKRVRWLDAPHLPHNWECGFLFEETDRTLFCGDLFTQGGDALPAVTDSDDAVLGNAMRMHAVGMDGMGIERNARRHLEKLAATRPVTLATMHGSAFRGDGGRLLLAFADALGV